jgi:hypothetical protein
VTGVPSAAETASYTGTTGHGSRRSTTTPSRSCAKRVEHQHRVDHPSLTMNYRYHELQFMINALWSPKLMIN